MTAPEPVAWELAVLLQHSPSCRIWAEQDEGPYHRVEQPTRRDIVEDREGMALQLGVKLAVQGGGPLQDACVEIWQCDALGRYSGFAPSDPAAVVTQATAPRAEYLPEERFLRGAQRTDGAGMVEFRTIYPGWYPGRTVHIHAIVRTPDHVFTSQLYFPDEVTDQVFESSPYSERPGRDTTNAADEIFPTGGDPALLDLTLTAAGYRAVICLLVPGIDDTFT